MIKITLRCVSVLTFLASLVALFTVLVDAYIYYAFPDVSEYIGIALVVYVLVTWFLLVTALKMWKAEELDIKSYAQFALALLLTAFLLSSAYTGWIQGTNTLDENYVEDSDVEVPTPYKADYFSEEELAREARCFDICSEVSGSTSYHVYVSGRDDGDVCECYSSNDDLLRMVPMD